MAGVRSHGDEAFRSKSGIGIEEGTLRGNVKRFQGGLVFEAPRLVYHSTLGSRVVKKRRSSW